MLLCGLSQTRFSVLRAASRRRFIRRRVVKRG